MSRKPDLCNFGMNLFAIAYCTSICDDLHASEQVEQPVLMGMSLSQRLTVSLPTCACRLASQETNRSVEHCAFVGVGIAVAVALNNRHCSPVFGMVHFVSESSRMKMKLLCTSCKAIKTTISKSK